MLAEGCSYLDHEAERSEGIFTMRFKNQKGEEVSRVYRDISSDDFDVLESLDGESLVNSEILQGKRFKDYTISSMPFRL